MTANRFRLAGVGTHAASLLSLDLNKTATRFSAFVGVDDESAGQAASVEFIVYGDGKFLWQSGVMKTGDAAKEVNVDLAGVQNLLLRVTNGGDGNVFDHADWAGAKIEHSGAAPTAIAWGGERVALTPKAPLEPRINGARAFGVRPGAPLLFKVEASGKKPYMLQIGNIGTPGQFNTRFRPTNLTPNKQYFQVSLWSLLSAPLLLSRDIASLDDFTLGLIINSEVIAVNQDTLGAPARRIALG